MKRVYKKAYSHEKSKNILYTGKGTHFDPNLVDIFMENESLFEKVGNKMKDHTIVSHLLKE